MPVRKTNWNTQKPQGKKILWLTVGHDFHYLPATDFKTLLYKGPQASCSWGSKVLKHGKMIC